MSEIFKFYNPAFGGNPEVNAEYTIPSEGEYFMTDSDPGYAQIGYRIGNKIYIVDKMTILQSVYPDMPKKEDYPNETAYHKAKSDFNKKQNWLREGDITNAATKEFAKSLGLNTADLPVIPIDQGVTKALGQPVKSGSIDEFKTLSTQSPSTEPLVDMKAKKEAEAPANAAAAASAAAQGGDVFAEQEAAKAGQVQAAATGQVSAETEKYFGMTGAEFEAAKAAGGEGTVKAAGFQGEQGGDIRGTLLGPSEFNNVINNFRQAGLTDEEIERDVINRVPNTLTGVTDIFLKQGVTQDQTFVDSVVGKRSEGDVVSPGGDEGSKITEDMTTQQNQQKQEAQIEALLGVLPPDSQQMVRDILDITPEVTNVTDMELEKLILEKFNELNTSILEPAYADLVRRTEADLNLQIGRMQEDRDLQKTLEIEAAQKRFEDTQANLEGSGMTRSGLAAKQLGEQSATRGATGLGEVQKLSQRISEGTGRAFQRSLQDLSLAGESKLGTAGVSGISGVTGLLGDVTGSIQTDKISAQQALLERAKANVESKQDLELVYT